MKKAIIISSVIAGVLLVIIGLSFLFLNIFSESEVVPDVTGKNINEATQLLKDAGFKVKTNSDFSDTVEKGLVVSQKKEAGAMARRGARITLTLSKGKEQIKVPNVVGSNGTEAQDILKMVGFSVLTEEKFSDFVKRGTVMTQSIPDGKQVDKGSEITIVISRGKEENSNNKEEQIPDNKEQIPINNQEQPKNNEKKQVRIPNLVGTRLSRVEEVLKELGINFVVERELSDSAFEGMVIAQSFPKGSMADVGSTITLTVSGGLIPVTVPDVTGMTLDNATKAIEDLNLIIRTEIRCSDTVKEGCIISQSIPGGMKTPSYTVINVVVSGGVGNKSGTTPSNANNFGKITEQGNVVYISDNGIYAMRKDTKETRCISTEPAVSVNVVGDWIYYTDGRYGGIYKVRIDGTKKTQISIATSYKLYVEGDWIYYTSDFVGGQIYKMKTDGSSEKLIVRNQCTEYIVHNGYIYYILKNNKLVYRCDLNGEGKKVVCPGFSGGDLSLVGNKLVVTENYNIKSVNLDGSGLTSFGTSNVQYTILNGNGNWLYYVVCDFNDKSGKSSGIGRMRPDGSEKKLLYQYEFKDSVNNYINVVDGWIYFENEHENDALYRLKTDGSRIEAVW